jgi:hypothetical protein
MYGPMWRALLGPWPVKLLQAVLLALGFVAVCFIWLFPLVADHLPFNDNTVTTAPTTPPTPENTPAP